MPLVRPKRLPAGVKPIWSFYVPGAVSDDDHEMFARRERQVQQMQDRLPADLPAWDANKPLTKAVLRRIRETSVEQFTTVPDGSLCFYHLWETEMNEASLWVKGAPRTIRAEDLMAEQFGVGTFANERFLAALHPTPMQMRIRTRRKINDDPRAVSVRVVALLDDPCVVQFLPEYVPA